VSASGRASTRVPAAALASRSRRSTTATGSAPSNGACDSRPPPAPETNSRSAARRATKLRRTFSWVSITTSNRRPPNGRRAVSQSSAPAPVGGAVSTSSISPRTTGASAPA